MAPPRWKGDVDTLPTKTRNLKRLADSAPKITQQRHISYEPSGERIKSLLEISTQPQASFHISAPIVDPAYNALACQDDGIEWNDERECQFEVAGLHSLVVPEPVASIPAQVSKRKRTQAVGPQNFISSVRSSEYAFRTIHCYYGHH